MKLMHFFTRTISGRPYRIAAESTWDASKKRSVARQIVLGPAEPTLLVDVATSEKVGTKRVGDVGALLWAAEQLDVLGCINRLCSEVHPAGEVTLGEMVLAVALQRACCPGPKRDLAGFLEGCLPIVSCLPARAYTGQAFHRLASRVSAELLDKVQIELASAAASRFKLSTNVLAYDTTNFDTYIATTTTGKLAQRGHAKSKRRDLRIVGLGVLASETGHVPLLHRTCAGNSSDQAVLGDCLDDLLGLHNALDQAQGRRQPAARTLVRDGGFWSEQLELELEFVGYYSIISLPLGHGAAKWTLDEAAKPRAMRRLKGKYKDVRAARFKSTIGKEKLLERTLVVIESQELLAGQKRGIAAALTKARTELTKLDARVAKGTINKTTLQQRVNTILRNEHLGSFVVVNIGGEETAPTFSWRVDAGLRRELERTRLGRRVLCTDRHTWSTERILWGFRGQWKVEELFRRSKGGGIVPWGPSHQWSDASIRLHTFAAVLGLMLVSLVRLKLETELSTKKMLDMLSAIEATVIKPFTGKKGRPPTGLLRPTLYADQRLAVEVFELDRWMPSLSSSSAKRRGTAKELGAG